MFLWFDNQWQNMNLSTSSLHIIFYEVYAHYFLSFLRRLLSVKKKTLLLCSILHSLLISYFFTKDLILCGQIIKSLQNIKRLLKYYARAYLWEILMKQYLIQNIIVKYICIFLLFYLLGVKLISLYDKSMCIGLLPNYRQTSNYLL